MSLYLDASALLPALIQETASPRIEDFLLNTLDERLISEFAAAEVASAFSRLVRTRQMTEAEANEQLAEFDAWRVATATPVEIKPADVRLAGTYVRRFALALRAPDALHLAVARRLDATLVTLDRRLAVAAAEFGIALALTVDA